MTLQIIEHRVDYSARNFAIDYFSENKQPNVRLSNVGLIILQEIFHKHPFLMLQNSNSGSSLCGVKRIQSVFVSKGISTGFPKLAVYGDTLWPFINLLVYPKMR